LLLSLSCFIDTPPTAIYTLSLHDALPISAEHLQSQGFAARAVRPPTVPPGSARLRFSLTCGISDDELLRLENSLSNWREKSPSSDRKSTRRTPVTVRSRMPSSA